MPILFASFWTGVIVTLSIVFGVPLVIYIIGRRRGWWDRDPQPEPEPDPDPGPDPPPPAPTADLTVIFVHETGKRTWRQWLVMGGVKRYCRQSDKLDCIVLDDDATNEKGQRMYVDVVDNMRRHGLPRMAMVLRSGNFGATVPMPKTKAKAIEIIKANGG